MGKKSRGNKDRFKDRFYRTLKLDKETQELLRVYKGIRRKMMQENDGKGGQQ